VFATRLTGAAARPQHLLVVPPLAAAAAPALRVETCSSASAALPQGTGGPEADIKPAVLLPGVGLACGCRDNADAAPCGD